MTSNAMEDIIEISTNLSSEELEKLCDLAGLGLINLNVKTGEIKLNRKLTALTGYVPGEIPHSVDSRNMFVIEEDQAYVGKAMERLIIGGEDHYKIQYRMRRKDSSVVTIEECMFVRERNADGTASKLAGICNDLSRLMWAQEKNRRMEEENRRLAKGASHNELEEQNRLLRAANSAAAMIIGGIHQDYEMVLKQALQILGESIHAERAYIWRNQMIEGEMCCFSRSEWTITTPSKLSGENGTFHYKDFYPEWDVLTREHQNRNDTSRKLTADYKKFAGIKNDESIILIPLVLHGEFWGVIGFDDTDCVREFTDDEIEILGSGALIIASSISRNETFGKLNEARRSAIESTRAKGDFLSRMSHEIRTPMNAIIGMTTIAKRSGDESKMRYCLDKVDASSRQLLGLINDILDMSKIEANKLEINNAPFDFEKMIQYVINMIQVKLDEKFIDLKVDMNDVFTRSMISDELRLSQVLINLLGNAIKFTPLHGEIILKIREISNKDGKSKFRMEVIDNGIGIDKEKQNKLFESFEQADGGISRQYGGTGLGLSISKSIVNLMGGEIWVESVPGEGSDFIFEIEVGWGEELQISELISKTPTELRVLVVDDHEDVLEYFQNILESFSVECDVAGSGKEAIRMVELKKNEGKPYDIIFIDWNMPWMNGGETAREIKKRGSKDTICVMISVSEWGDIEKEAKTYGVTKFLSKPVLPSALYDAIIDLTHKSLVKMRSEEKNEIMNWSNHRILIAEDIDINREIIASILEDTKIEIIFAEDGEQVVKMFQKEKNDLDLILMDVQMPKMDGLEATKMIRTSGNGIEKEIPIIAMTANAFKEDAERCIEAGMNAHLAKPIDIDMLYSVLGKYLN